jgi:diguanylate cyclase (GGDEF)-like protein
VEHTRKRLNNAAGADGLIQLINRRGFIDRLRAEIGRSLRTRRHLSVALVGVDGPGPAEPSWAQALGDPALLRLARAIAQRIRPYDVVARYGPDELVLLFPETTRAQAEAMMARVERLEVALPGQPQPVLLRLSWGVAMWPTDGGDAESLLRAAVARRVEMRERGQGERAGDDRPRRP